MKLSKKLLFLIPFIFLTISSCSSDDSSPNPEPEVVNPANQKLVSISYPSSMLLAYMRDGEQYGYDDSKRINKIISSSFSNGVIYVNDNLIEVDLLTENISNVDMAQKTSMYLKNNSIELSISNTISKRIDTGVIYRIDRDSTVYTYENEYISKVMLYHKTLIQGDGKYRLEKQIESKVTNGNITQLKRTAFGEVIITNYTYDTNPNISMGEFAYETPFFLIGGSNVIWKDKLGKKNTNNIIAIENEYTEIPFQKSYKKINLKRNLDKYGRLSEILMSGSSITSNPNNTSTDFTDEKVIFKYE